MTAILAPGGSEGTSVHFSSDGNTMRCSPWPCAAAGVPSASEIRPMRTIDRVACFMTRSFPERGMIESGARTASPPSDDDFEIFRGHDHRGVPRTVEPLDQRHDVVGEAGL